MNIPFIVKQNENKLLFNKMNVIYDKKGLYYFGLTYTYLCLDEHMSVLSPTIKINIPNSLDGSSEITHRIDIINLDIITALVKAIEYVFSNDPFYRATPSNLQEAKEWAINESTTDTLMKIIYKMINDTSTSYLKRKGLLLCNQICSSSKCSTPRGINFNTETHGVVYLKNTTDIIIIGHPSAITANNEIELWIALTKMIAHLFYIKEIAEEHWVTYITHAYFVMRKEYVQVFKHIENQDKITTPKNTKLELNIYNLKNFTKFVFDELNSLSGAKTKKKRNNANQIT